MAHIILKKNKEQRILRGHPWIYKGEISNIEGSFCDGDIIRVKDYKNRFLGEGFINRTSQIAVRLITHNKEIIDKSFLKKRIEDAIQHRRLFTSGTNARRLIFSEGDFLPGLIADDYNGYIVIQTLTLGMDRRKDIIVEILKEVINPKAIYERNDVHAREFEGLPQTKGILHGSLPNEITCDIYGIRLLVDIENGQKTGLYLDQKENYAVLEKIAKDKNVLDCFCYTGGFGISAAYHGAKNVLGIDISDYAVETAKKNAGLNGFGDRCSWEKGNIFDILNKKARNKESYGIVILDPPSFTKAKESISSAIRGYKEINLRAIKLIQEKGFLITCCCSHHVKKDLFLDIISEAGKDVRKKLRLVEYRTQSKDHPILPAVPETEYLKCFILQVL